MTNFSKSKQVFQNVSQFEKENIFELVSKFLSSLGKETNFLNLKVAISSRTTAMSDAGSQFPHLSVEGLIFPFPYSCSICKASSHSFDISSRPISRHKRVVFSVLIRSFSFLRTYIHTLLEKEQQEKSTQQYKVSLLINPHFRPPSRLFFEPFSLAALAK